MKKILSVLCLIPLLNGCWDLEKGEKTGHIVKLSKAGIMFKTWDAELIRGGFNDGSGSNGKSFDFVVENEELVNKLKIAMESQKQVNIKYHKEWIALWRVNDTENYFLDDVSILGK